MSSQFQNRLVGVIVIVALGVIFLPDILDGKKQREEEQFAEIPLRPEIQESTLPEQEIETLDLGADELQSRGEQDSDANEAVDDSWHIAEQEAASASKPVSKPAVKSQAETKPVAQIASGWTIQLGSFNNATNVKGLVSRLRNKGFSAYTLPTKPVDGQLTKVFVGPNVSKDILSRMQNDIEKLTQLKGRIVAYNPVEK